MTKDEKEKLARAGKLVKQAVPDDFAGSVKYNIVPGRKKIKVNIDRTIILEGT